MIYQTTFEGKENRFSAEKLRNGETGIITGVGNSMTPIIRNGQRCIVEPVTIDTEINKNDVVFVRVGGNYYLHKMVAIKGLRYQIGNNHGKINGWVGKENIYGIVRKIL